jgi:sarcosine oxidase subunit beta
MATTYDVIVIGAGSVGVPTTYFLAEKGCKVLCIDRHTSAGQGQNKAAIGGVRATHSDPAKIKICQTSLEIFATWREKHGTDIGWKKGGYCFPVFREKEEKILRGLLPIQKRYDLNIDWVGPTEIQEIVPGITPKNLMGGTFSPDDGQSSPLMATQAMEKAARRRGAEFHYNEEVVGLLIENSVIQGVRTKSGDYYSNSVVNAAGAFAKEIGTMAGIDIPVTPDSHEAGISAPVEEFLGPLVVDLRAGKEGKTSNFYFAQNHERGLIFCYTPSVLMVGTDRRSTSEFMPIIANRLVELIPRLKNLRIRRIWRGLYPMTPDGTAIVGKAPRIKNLFLGVGMCGQGFMMGPGVGKNLASLVVDGKPELDPDIFEYLSPERDFNAAKNEALK